MAQAVGKITQVIGPVVDVEFEAGKLPEIYHALKAKLKAAGHNTNVGDEGGFAPNIGSAEEAYTVQDINTTHWLAAGRRQRFECRRGHQRHHRNRAGRQLA